MKCDELKVHKAYNRWIDEEMPTPNDDLICNEVYLKDEVDAAIAELKLKLEDAQATAYAESVDAGMENRRLKRALWLARAKRATEKADSFIDIKVTYNGVCNIDHSVYPQTNARRMLTCDEWLDVWTNVWEKCLKKAEEYK